VSTPDSNTQLLSSHHAPLFSALALPELTDSTGGHDYPMDLDLNLAVPAVHDNLASVFSPASDHLAWLDNFHYDESIIDQLNSTSLLAQQLFD
jgi:hypothetical protein